MNTSPHGFLSSLRQLGENCATLFKLEAELTKMEMKEEARRTAVLSAIAVGGVVVVLTGIAVLMLGLASLLALVFVEEGQLLGALGFGQCLVGLLAISSGAVTAWCCIRKLEGHSLFPKRSVNRIKHDIRRLSGNAPTNQL